MPMVCRSIFSATSRFSVLLIRLELFIWITIIQPQKYNEELVGVTMTQSVTESILFSRESFQSGCF